MCRLSFGNCLHLQPRSGADDSESRRSRLRGSPPRCIGAGRAAERAARGSQASRARALQGAVHGARETYDKLRQVQDLMRHSIPNGDPAVIFDRALTLLIAELSKTKFADHGAAALVSTSHARLATRSRSVKRDVWPRDGGRCAFHGEQGRCAERVFWNFTMLSRTPMAAPRRWGISSCAVVRTTVTRQSSGLAPHVFILGAGVEGRLLRAARLGPDRPDAYNSSCAPSCSSQSRWSR